MNKHTQNEAFIKPLTICIIMPPMMMKTMMVVSLKCLS